MATRYDPWDQSEFSSYLIRLEARFSRLFSEEIRELEAEAGRLEETGKKRNVREVGRKRKRADYLRAAKNGIRNMRFDITLRVLNEELYNARVLGNMRPENQERIQGLDRLRRRLKELAEDTVVSRAVT